MMIYLDLTFNLTLLVALSILSGSIDKRWNRHSRVGVLLQGLLFGGAAALGSLLRPLHLDPGLIFDGRSLMVSLCALFFGPWAAGLAGALAICYRVWLGGVGALTGSLVILSSIGIGLVAHYHEPPEVNPPDARRLYLFGLCVHLVMLALMFTLPGGAGLGVVMRIGLPVMLLYPLATILAGTILSDQVESNRVMAVLHAREEHYERLFNSSNDGVFVYPLANGKPAKFTEVNAVACSRLGYSREELIELSPGDIDAGGMEEARKRGLTLLANTGQALFEMVLVGKSGERIPVEISSRVFVKEGERFVLSIAREITDRQQAEEERAKLQDQLNQAQKMEAIGVLAGGIAHDFNNILSAIFGYTEMARQEAKPGSILAKDCDCILIAANRAKDLVQQILAFSRQTTAERIPLKVQPLVKESLKMLRASLPTTITIREDLHPQCGAILAAPTHIYQIVMNLSTNAFHAMEERGGVLTIAVRGATIVDPPAVQAGQITPGEYVELTVSDTGAGIGPEVIDRIFDPFFTTKEVGKGTGMGLSITHGIISSYGGAITVDSVLGQGTTFHVYFPVIHEKAVIPATQTAAPTGNERILFVEDEELLSEMGKEMLERLGYRVTVYRCGSDALAAVAADPERFDLVITDQTMPGMTGIDLARRVLKLRPALPIILCTGFSNLVNEQSAKEIGIRQFAVKPITLASMAQLIRKALADSRAG